MTKENYFYCFELQICSNINTCVCEMGWGGHDCSKIVASFTPFTPIKPTQAPADNSSGLTPSNTYIRKYSFTFHTCTSIRNHDWKNIDDIWQSKRSAHICSRNDKYNWYIAAEPTTTPKNKETRYEKDDQNTAGLVMALMLGVGFVFGAFATAALCYRLYVRCNNIIQKMMLHNQNVLCAIICWYRWSMPLCYLLPLRCENCLQSYG